MVTNVDHLRRNRTTHKLPNPKANASAPPANPATQPQATGDELDMAGGDPPLGCAAAARGAGTSPSDAGDEQDAICGESEPRRVGMPCRTRTAGPLGFISRAYLQARLDNPSVKARLDNPSVKVSAGGSSLVAG